MSVSMIGAPFEASGDIDAGRMTKESLDNQANNLDAQAQESEDQGQYNAMRHDMIADQRVGIATAAYGAGGVSSSSGSVLDVMQASHQNAALDRMNILHGADVKAINYKNQAAMDRYGGESAMYGAYWKALGDLTGGALSTGAWNNAASGNTGGSGGGSEGSGLGDMSAEGASAESGGEGASMGEAGAGAGDGIDASAIA